MLPPAELHDRADRLEATGEELRQLVQDAQDLLAGTPEEDRAACYWLAHLANAVGAGSMHTLTDSVAALRAAAEAGRDEVAP